MNETPVPDIELVIEVDMTRWERANITSRLVAAGVEIGPICQAGGDDGIDHMSPRLAQRWCDDCGHNEITAVVYDEHGSGMVVWAELVHVYRPHLLAGGVA